MKKIRETKNKFPLIKKKGFAYDIESVDKFFDLARASYNNKIAEHEIISSDDIRLVSFPVVKFGYSARHVDTAIDRLEQVFLKNEAQKIQQNLGHLAIESEKNEMLNQIFIRLSRKNKKMFNRKFFLVRGYNVSEVDDFCKQLVSALKSPTTNLVVEVSDVEFTESLSGYDEHQVDYFIDYVRRYLFLEV